MFFFFQKKNWKIDDGFFFLTAKRRFDFFFIYSEVVSRKIHESSRIFIEEFTNFHKFRFFFFFEILKI